MGGVFLRIFIDVSDGKKVRIAESVVFESHSDSQVLDSQSLILFLNKLCEILVCRTYLSLMVVDDFAILSAHSFPSMFRWPVTHWR